MKKRRNKYMSWPKKVSSFLNSMNICNLNKTPTGKSMMRKRKRKLIKRKTSKTTRWRKERVQIMIHQSRKKVANQLTATILKTLHQIFWLWLNRSLIPFSKRKCLRVLQDAEHKPHLKKSSNRPSLINRSKRPTQRLSSSSPHQSISFKLYLTKRINWTGFSKKCFKSN